MAGLLPLRLVCRMRIMHERQLPSQITHGGVEKLGKETTSIVDCDRSRVGAARRYIAGSYKYRYNAVPRYLALPVTAP
jgi:hypothetical protein